VKTGKEIFEGLVQYPLPDRRNEGIHDYIVYLVDQTKPFGKGARQFFNRFYGNHHVLEAKSLEGTIAALRTHAAAHHVTQIRELTLVAHGAANELYPAVIQGTTDPKYKCITEFSLCALQEDFQLDDETSFPTFRAARSVVCGLLKDDSWVTIRACNVGQSRDILYALYVFFGGKANIYAPTEYVTFPSIPVRRGSRVTNPSGVYDHLRKQHFLTTDEHSPERKRAIVNALLDPGAFADEIELAALGDGPAPADVAAYRALRTSLDDHRIPPSVRAALDASGHQLTPKAFAERVQTGVRWNIIDRVTEQGEPLWLVYEIRHAVENGHSKLIARPRIMDARSNQPTLPIQLMMSKLDADLLKNKPVVLADYADDGTPESAAVKTTAEAMRALLDARKLADASIDLQDQIQRGLQQEVSLDDATVVPKTTTSWSIAGSKPLLVAWIDYERNHLPAHSLVVQFALEGNALAAHQLDIIARHDSIHDPDLPGVELPAYLDRFTPEELQGFIDHLRELPHASNAFFIYHASQAIVRKHGYTPSPIALGSTLGDYPYLRPSDAADIDATSFRFNFTAEWNDVRASSGRSTVFTTDPFLDKHQLLSHTLPLDDTRPFICDDADPDSPAVDLDAVREYESRGSRARYFKNQGGKGDWPTAEVSEPASCTDFAEALAKLKELQAQGYMPAQIREMLEQLTASDGQSLLTKLFSIKDDVAFATGMVGPDLGDVLAWVDVFQLIVTDAGWKDWLETLVLDFVEGGDIIAIPAYLIAHVFNEINAAYARDKKIGELTAIRWWLYKLGDLAADTPVPESPFFALGTDEESATRGYREVYTRDHYGRLWLGWELSLASQFVLSPSDLRDGFVDGVNLMERIAPDVLAGADRYASELIDKLPIDPCKLKHLRAEGFINFAAVRAAVLSSLAWAVLKKLPVLPVSP
jgi:hypothetical protein